MWVFTPSVCVMFQKNTKEDEDDQKMADPEN